MERDRTPRPDDCGAPTFRPHSAKEFVADARQADCAIARSPGTITLVRARLESCTAYSLRKPPAATGSSAEVAWCSREASPIGHKFKVYGTMPAHGRTNGPFVTTWIVRCTPGPGIRVAVKDLMDVQGFPTTAGCRALAERADAADADAACLMGVRAATAEGRASIVGKVNLHELAFGITGINPWYGTPVNPLDPRRGPGGSSSGSAVAVAAGEADVAVGTDTGGSVRLPAACCGVVGLKTTWGRVPTTGVRIGVRGVVLDLPEEPEVACGVTPRNGIEYIHARRADSLDPG